MFGKARTGRGSQGRQKRNQHKNSTQAHNSSKRARSSHHNSSTDTAKKRKKRGPPSAEALELSDRLKKLSREKKLDEGLALFWDSSNNMIRDGHHACIMVDMAARCGKIAVRHFLSSYYYRKMLKHFSHFVKNFLTQFFFLPRNTRIHCIILKEGEKLLEQVTKEGTHISVETKTALMKVSKSYD